MLKLRFAVVGTGNIAKLHVEALLSCGQELVAVCNHNIEKAMFFLSNLSGRENVAPAEFGCTVFSDLNEMLDKVPIDVLFVTTPHLTHVDVAFMAVRRGINCIIEKPLDISLAKAQYLKEEAERTGAIISVVAPSRFFAPTERIKKAIDSGQLGKPAFGLVTVQAWRDEAYYNSNSWRGTWAGEGGGVLVNQSVHELDIICHFLGEVDSVYGLWRNINHPYIEVDDTAMGIVQFKSGAIANILLSNSVNPAQNVFVRVIGSNGHTVSLRTHEGVEEKAGTKPSEFRPFNDIFTLVDDETLASFRENDYKDVKPGEWTYYFFAQQVKEMVQAIEAKRTGLSYTLRNDVSSAQGCMMIFQGIYLSQRLGRPVTRKEILDDAMTHLSDPVQPQPVPKATAAAAPAAKATATATASPAATTATAAATNAAKPKAVTPAAPSTTATTNASSPAKPKPAIDPRAVTAAAVAAANAAATIAATVAPAASATANAATVASAATSAAAPATPAAPAAAPKA